jgi:uncharacterized protein (TIGR02145 family)
MSRVFILLSVCFFFLENLLGQEQQQSLPSVEQLSSKRTNYNLEEIKVRWKKAALENCAGVPCVVTPPAPSFTCGTSTVSDIDGNSYHTVSIGSQCWLKENLKVSKYNDGTIIPDKTTSSDWGTLITGARTGYDVNLVPLSDYVGTFGYLYNWYAATDSRKLCPTGWHVPTDAEWTIMIQTLDPSAVIINSGNELSFTGNQSATAGTALKSTTTNISAGSGLGWDPESPPSPGTNTSGFSALPGGFRSIVAFNSIRYRASFLSVTQKDSGTFWGRRMSYDDSYVERILTLKATGLSVRCLKDLSI